MKFAIGNCEIKALDEERGEALVNLEKMIK